MATLRLEIKDSKFVSHNGVNLKIFGENYVKGNGWEAYVRENGRIECIAKDFYSGKQHLLKLKIHNGYVKLILKIGDNKGKLLKSYRIINWPIHGVIGLPGGYIDTRRPYIRDAKFQNFLDEYSISSVRYESANGIYQLVQETRNGEIIYDETIETDGIAKLILEDEANGIRRYEVTNATWVIKNVLQDNKKLRIIYTTDRIEEIMNIPKY